MQVNKLSGLVMALLITNVNASFGSDGTGTQQPTRPKVSELRKKFEANGAAKEAWVKEEKRTQLPRKAQEYQSSRGEVGEEARQDERRAQMAREYNLTQPHGELGEEARQDERRAQIAREYYLTQPHGEIGEEARQRPNSPSPDAQPVLKEQQQSQLKMSPSQRRMMRQLDEPMLGDEKAKG